MFIVVLSIGVEMQFCIGEVVKGLDVEELGSKPRIEAFDGAIEPRGAGFDAKRFGLFAR